MSGTSKDSTNPSLGGWNKYATRVPSPLCHVKVPPPPAGRIARRHFESAASDTNAYDLSCLGATLLKLTAESERCAGSSADGTICVHSFEAFETCFRVPKAEQHGDYASYSPHYVYYHQDCWETETKRGGSSGWAEGAGAGDFQSSFVGTLQRFNAAQNGRFQWPERFRVSTTDELVWRFKSDRATDRDIYIPDSYFSKTVRSEQSAAYLANLHKRAQGLDGRWQNNEPDVELHHAVFVTEEDELFPTNSRGFMF